MRGYLKLYLAVTAAVLAAIAATSAMFVTLPPILAKLGGWFGLSVVPLLIAIIAYMLWLEGP